MTQEAAIFPGRLGRYEVLRKLGQGGMGAVYLAHDSKLDRRVAIKVLPPDSIHDAGAVARFQREAKALAQLSHPGIIQAYDSETDEEGRHFLVMEYVEGTSLDKVLREQGTIAPALAADYVYQAARALEHAHAKGLIHRDIKPSNLLLTPDSRIKLLDLGLARFLQDQIRDPAQTRDGVGMGTPDYASPEQFRDAHNVDQRADIYSLGCTLYHLITGRVPFPGSSMQEKFEAHQHRQPTPLPELCPDAPAGLVMTVARMMAKSPGERFQSAAELAEALAPHVAGSSPSFAQIQTSPQWEVSTTTFRGARPRGRLFPWLIAGLSLVGSAVMVVLVLSGWPAPSAPPTTPLAAGPTGKEPPDKQATTPEPKPLVMADPNVLTVSKDAKDGGQYRKINEALDKAKQGQTIQVLDDATYAEMVILGPASRHAGVTLEAVRQARLQIPNGSRNLIVITDVPGIVVRGFRFVADVASATTPGGKLFVRVNGTCPDLLLERLQFDSAGLGGFNAIETYGQVSTTGSEDVAHPVVIRDCAFYRIDVGVYAQGVTDDYRNPLPLWPFVVQNNFFENGAFGLKILGEVPRAQVIGNTMQGITRRGIHLERLFPRSGGILIANNTLSDTQEAFGLWDSGIITKDVQIRNNLVVNSRGPDMVFWDSGGNPTKDHGPGDGKALSQAWRWDHNWRETPVPSGDAVQVKGWIPPSAEDVRRETIKGVGRDPKQEESFLRPEKNSELATTGAGVSDPSLPAYVGALPPLGVTPWDWSRTWLAPPPGKLITVSKDPKDGGTHRTLQAALTAATAWSTIRVLDAETYDGPLEITDPEKHTGLVLEAPKQAILRLTGKSPGLLTVKGVPHVRLRGFRFRDQNARSGGYFVMVQGKPSGVVLEDLDIEATTYNAGVLLQPIQGAPADPPVVVRRCSIKGPGVGVLVLGPPQPGRDQATYGGVFVQDNRIGCGERGVFLRGRVARIQVVGNLLWGSDLGACQVQDLPAESHSILIANNTICKCMGGFRIWCNTKDARFEPGQVELCANLIVDNVFGDALLYMGEDKGVASPELARAAVEHWRFEGNWRDLGGTAYREILPLSPADRKAEGLRFVSTDPKQPGFMQPVDGSPLGAGGVGAKGPWLPEYAGAIPPKGVAPWDWSVTWRARLAREH